MNAFVARQPILDRTQNVVAYELLFRSSPGGLFCDAVDGTEATSAVLANSLFAIGLTELVRGTKAFLNFNRDLLVSEFPSILPPGLMVVEILESVRPDPNVVAACRQLKAAGYTLALDDFTSGEGLDSLIALADIIKVDFQAVPPELQAELARRLLPSGVKLLAEKLETSDSFERACSLGYSLFQGYFLARPTVIGGTQPPHCNAFHYELLRATLASDVEFGRIEEVIRREMSLVYKLLRYINSARFHWYGRIESIQHALILLGENEIRKWVSLAIVSTLAENRPTELIRTGMIRARFCELLGPLVGAREHQASLFLMGMFSVIDAILNRDLEAVLKDLDLGWEVSSVLLGTTLESGFARVYRLVRAYETGNWSVVSDMAGQLGVHDASISALYLESVQWADETAGSVTSAPAPWTFSKMPLPSTIRTTNETAREDRVGSQQFVSVPSVR